MPWPSTSTNNISAGRLKNGSRAVKYVYCSIIKTSVDISHGKPIQQLLSALIQPVSSLCAIFSCLPPQTSLSLSLSSFICAHVLLRYFGIHWSCDYGLVCIFDKSADDRRRRWNMKLVPRIREQTWLLHVHTWHARRAIPMTTTQPPQCTPPLRRYRKGELVFFLIVSKYIWWHVNWIPSECKWSSCPFKWIMWVRRHHFVT